MLSEYSGSMIMLAANAIYDEIEEIDE